MHAHYYRVKAAALAWDIAQAKINATLVDARRTFEAELTACGLDAAKAYQLNDATQDIEEAEPPTAGA